MAAELIGTAYVRIKPITAGLGKDVADAVDKDLKAAQPAIDKSMGESGDRAGKSMGSGLADGLTDSLDDVGVDLKKRGNKLGGDTVKETRKGADKETKKKNPFASMFDGFDASMKKMSKSFKRNIKKINFRALDKDFSHFDKKLRGLPGFGPLTWLTLLGIPALGGALKLAGGYIVGLTAALGSVVVAAAGALAALGGLVALVPGIGVLMSAFKGEGADEFKNQIKEIAKAFLPIQEAIQTSGLFAGLADGFKSLTVFAKPLALFAGYLGDMMGAMMSFSAATLASGKNQGYFDDILGESLGQFEVLGRIIARLADTLPALFAALGPVATKFLLEIEKMVITFQDFINLGSEDGSLKATLDGWWTTAMLVGGALADITIGLWNLLSAGNDVTNENGMLQGFRDMSAEFRAWSIGEENVDRIKGAFQAGLEIFREVNLLIGDIFTAIGAPIAEGNTEGVMNFITTIREDWLPAFEELAGVLAQGGVGEALQGLLDAIISFMTSIGESGSLAAFIETLSTALGILADILTQPGVAQAAGILLPLYGVLKAMGTLRLFTLASGLTSFGKGLLNIGTPATAGLPGMMDKLGTSIGMLGLKMLSFTVFGAPVIAILAAIAIAAGAAFLIWKHWDTLTEWFGNLPTWGKALVVFGLAIAFPLGVIVGLIAIIKNFDKIKEIFGKVLAAVIRFAKRMGSTLSKLPGIVGRALLGALKAVGRFGASAGSALIGWIAEAVPKIPGQLLSFASAIGGFFLGLAGSILGWVGGLAVSALSWIGEMIAAFPLAFANATADMAIFFLSIPFRIIEWLAEILPPIVEAITGFVTDWVPAFVGWITEAIPAAAAKLLEWSTALFGAILGFVSELPGKFVDAVVALWQWVVDAVPTMTGKLAEWSTSAFTAIAGFVTDLPGKFVDAVVAMWQWAVDAADIIAEKIGGFATAAFDAIIGFVEDIPSKVGDAVAGLTSIGKSIVASIKQGIIDAWEGLTSWLSSKATSLYNNTIGRLPGVSKMLTGSIAPGLGSGGNQPANTFGGAVSRMASASIFSRPTTGIATPATRGFGGLPGGPKLSFNPIVQGGTGAEAYVKIENATFNEPTDIDMLVAKVAFSARTL